MAPKSKCTLECFAYLALGTYCAQPDPGSDADLDVRKRILWPMAE